MVSERVLAQAVEQVAHRRAAVTQGVLQRRIKLGRTLAQVRHEEQRVVTEAVVATRRREDFAMPLAVGDQGARIVGAAPGRFVPCSCRFWR
jgi:hypothetical protein